MSNEKRELVLGIKTFFVVPDLSLFPEEFLNSFFLKGYETYFIHDDPYCPLESKIHTILSLFPRVILFFNIDRPVQGIEWPAFIENLQNTYGERAMIGVIYQKRITQEEIRKREWLYLYKIGIICGCISMDFQKSKNLYRFMNVLCANQAKGQRRFLRAMCGDSYKANFVYRGREYRCILRDISISHFSCIFPGDRTEFPMHEKIYEIQMNLKGILIKTDAVLCLKRVLANDTIHVFVFRTSEDREGLNPDHLLKVNGIIHRSLTQKIMGMLKDAFLEKGKQTRLQQ
ncbi:hypothetical protein [Marispirochaeta sp.]|uniref:hypothetical protein n=1 Tax=Marispirochaeta sp. TaxID=2038653 RepID=UPI0029C6B336|nr:hypothetical protein [Marispirochaeta sp.]